MFRFLVILFVVVPVAFAEVIHVSPSDNVAKIIGKGQEEDIFSFKRGNYSISSTIHVPPGVVIEGNDSLLRTAFFMNEITFFDVTKASNSCIKNLSLELGNRDLGISTQADNPSVTTNLRIENVTIQGNLNHILMNSSEQSSAAISLFNVENVNLINNRIRNTIGGIHVFGSHIQIRSNWLSEVNFGNIVVEGAHIIIDNNVISESGKGTFFNISEGDAITINSASSNIDITNNTIETGYCYLLWSHPNVSFINVVNNSFQSSVTDGAYFEKNQYLYLSGNQFDLNQGSGLAIDNGSSHVLIQDNSFYGNSIFIAPLASDINFHSNVFSGNQTNDTILNKDSPVSLEGNTVDYFAQDVDPALLTLITEDGVIVSYGSSLRINRAQFSSMSFQLINDGQMPIKFIGLPPVVLSSHVLVEDEFRFNPLGRSLFDSLMVSHLDQPHKLSLRPGESMRFSLRKNDVILSKYADSIIVNIPTNIYKPYWFELILV